MPEPLSLARRLDRVSASQTQQVLLAVEALRRQGVDIIDLGAGEPDFPTPEHVNAAAVEAIAAGHTKYTAGPGIAPLREAIAAHYRGRYGIECTPAHIVVTSGGKQGLSNVAMALFGQGDEVITHVPGWPSIVEQIHLAGADAVRVRTAAEEGFDVRADSILEAITPRTRGIVLNSPGNPTGAIMRESELSRLAEGVAGRHIWLILDLCYEQLLYDETPHNLPGVLASRVPGQTVLVGSASKSYAMTGVAMRVDPRAACHRSSLQRGAEPLDVPCDLDHATCRSRGPHRSADVCRPHARRISNPPGCTGRVDHRRRPVQDYPSGGRVLRFPRCVGAPVTGGATDIV